MSTSQILPSLSVSKVKWMSLTATSSSLTRIEVSYIPRCDSPRFWFLMMKRDKSSSNLSLRRQPKKLKNRESGEPPNTKPILQITNGEILCSKSLTELQRKTQIISSNWGCNWSTLRLWGVDLRPRTKVSDTLIWKELSTLV